MIVTGISYALFKLPRYTVAMDSLKHRWKRTPATVRKPLVMIVGGLFIIAAGLTGWLPGPGGIPLFLIGIAILATEFEWAKGLRDYVIKRVHQAGDLWRKHKVIGTFLLLVCAAAVAALSVTAYRMIRG